MLGLNQGSNSQKNQRVWIERYGCSASMNDSEMIAGLLKKDGYKISTSEHDATVNIIVTCSVKDATEHKMLYRISQLSKSGNPLIVAGCLPKADRIKVESINPSASLLGPNSIDRVSEVVSTAISGKKEVALDYSLTHKVNLPRIRVNPIVSIVQIGSGCMSQCSFCQTKLSKGDLRSYRIGDIIRQVRSDVKDGCREVWLSSTDNGCYGKDIGSDLGKLLRSCCEVEGDFKIRVGMMNPMYVPHMADSLIDIFANNDKILKFLHIPVQSGSDRILGKMKRGHNARLFQEVVNAFRKRIPEITIATDIIVGYPSETEEDFQKTLDLLTRTQPDIVNSSKYSARPGVLSAKDKGVNSLIVKTRTHCLDKLVEKISIARNSLWNGWTGDIIIDEITNRFVQGRNYAYKPVVVASKAKLNPSCIFELGSKVKTKVFSFSRFALRGTLLNQD